MPQRAQHLFGRAHALILRLLEQRQPAHVGVGETDAAVAPAGARRHAPQETGHRPDHGVPPQHDVDVGHERLDRGVRLYKVGEDQRDPVVPAPLQHPGAGYLRVRRSQRQVVGQHARAGRHPQVLVGGDDVAHRRAVVQHVVPGGAVRQPVDREVGHHPRTVRERVRLRAGRRVAVDDAAGREARQGVDGVARPETDRGPGAGIQRVDVDAAIRRRRPGRVHRRTQPVHEHAGADVRRQALHEMTDDAAVPLRPGQVFRIGRARTEVVPAGPGRGGVERAAIVVAAAVVDVPAQPLGRPAGAVEIVAHGEPVERDDVRVGRACRARQRECPAAARIAIVAVAPRLGLERGEFRAGAGFLGVNQGPRGDLVAPLAVDEQPLLRRMAQMPRVVDRLPVRTVTLHQAHLDQQFANRRRFRARHRHVVRSPGVGRDIVLSPAGVAARLRLELQQHEVAHAAPGELPAGRQPRHAAPHDDDRDLARLLRRGELAVPQAVADTVRGADNLAADSRRGRRPPGRRRARPAAEAQHASRRGTEPEEVPARQRLAPLQRA